MKCQKGKGHYITFSQPEQKKLTFIYSIENGEKLSPESPLFRKILIHNFMNKLETKRTDSRRFYSRVTSSFNKDGS